VAVDELRARIERHIREHELIAPGGEVVAFVSGGADSTCLWHALGALGYRVSALHVNHGLRGKESEADARFCREAFGAEVVERRGGTTEDELRQIRYSFATDRLRATGHTASDQVETVLYRLAASPGRRALLGMRERDGRLVRPLLAVWRAATEAWCEQAGLPWRDDPSNASAAFARNRARHGLIPALRELHPAAERNVLRTLELLRDEAEVLDAAVAAVLAEAGSPPSVAHLRALPPALARLTVQRLADAAGGPAVSHRTAEILALAEHGALDVGGGLRARIEGGCLAFVATPPRVPA
jgi:tRNA(Ile)-lysidine synthase